MKLFNLSLVAISTALVLGCNSGYYDDGSGTPGGDARPIPTGGGTSANVLTLDGEEFYVNGANIAWMSFANDFGNGFDETKATALMQKVVDAGGNTVRWWVHTNGTKTPAWNGGLVAEEAMQAQTIADMKQALSAANKLGIKVMFSLWSFDMARSDQSGVPAVADNNYALLSDRIVRQSYVDNFLTPLVEEIKDEPALLALEIFNEPENMLENWANPAFNVTMDEIYTTTAVFTAAIKKAAADSEVMVTTGPKSLGMYFNNTGNNDGGSYAYSDTQMEIYLGNGYPSGLPTGYSKEMAHLDFYAPHYYDDLNKEGHWSPFYHHASYWELDKPIVMGEFFVDKTANKPAEFDYFNDPLSEEELCGRLVTTGYAGGLSWQLYDYGESVINCIEYTKQVLDNGGEEPGEPDDAIDFEDGDISAFGVLDENSDVGNPVAGLSLAHNSTEGYESSNSLSMLMDKEAGEKKAYLLLPKDAAAPITEVSMWIKYPTGADAAEIGGGKFYAKVGSGWAFVDGAWTSILPSQGWVKATWKPETPLTEVQEIGFQVYGNGTGSAFKGEFLFDDVVIK